MSSWRERGLAVSWMRSRTASRRCFGAEWQDMYGRQDTVLYHNNVHAADATWLRPLIAASRELR